MRSLATAPSSATTTMSNGHSRSLSVKTNTKPRIVNAPPVSDIRLFVTNLRLLDLDLRDDWPGITAQTYSGKNADQKQRISSTEWALFRLFELWDAEETAQKLQPFFPPLEPLQSVNLRAALFRCLNEMKKNGVLGRESLLRKTMLDECKGEKFYEVLAIFSNVVLKKSLLSQRRGQRTEAIAKTFATASTISEDDQMSLLPLAIAHKAALMDLLQRKEEKRRRYREFERMLNSKAEEIGDRMRKRRGAAHDKQSAMSQKQAASLKKELKDNWVGNQKWIDVMLQGDNIQSEDAFLTSTFDQVWHMVEQGRKMKDATSETGLLENLQSRVQEQQDRLRKWQEFHVGLKKEISEPAENEPKAAKSMKTLTFDAHLQYQVSTSTRERNMKDAHKPNLRIEFQDILDSMDSELARISSNVPQNDTAGHVSKRRTSASHGSRSPIISRRKTTRSDSNPTVPTSPSRSKRQAPERKMSTEQFKQPARPKQDVVAATPFDSEATLVGQQSSMQTAATNSRMLNPPVDFRPSNLRAAKPSPPTKDYAPEPSSLPRAANVVHSPEPHIESSAHFVEEESTYPSEPPVLNVEQAELDPEEALAEQIITSIGEATPSPVKKPQPRMSLSLMERTRMSMARTTSFEPVAESPSPPLLPSFETEPPPSELPQDKRATLLERTRLSMAAMQSRPRQSLAPKEKKDKRKSSRQSLFPINQFDTPRNRKSFELLEEEKSAERTPKEDLFSDEVDYDRIFKSRPRIATSPVFSPPPGAQYDDDDGFDEGVTGIDLGDVDQDEDEDGFTKTWAESPSRRRTGMMR